MKIKKVPFNKNLLLLMVVLLVAYGCQQQQTTKNKIRGKWRSEDGKTSLTINQKEFTLNEGEEPIAESYFVKGDSIFTSYEGSQPYTKFAVKNLSDKTLTLVYPDSTSVNFVR